MGLPLGGLRLKTKPCSAFRHKHDFVFSLKGDIHLHMEMNISLRCFLTPKTGDIQLASEVNISFFLFVLGQRSDLWRYLIRTAGEYLQLLKWKEIIVPVSGSLSPTGEKGKSEIPIQKKKKELTKPYYCSLILFIYYCSSMNQSMLFSIIMNSMRIRQKQLRKQLKGRIII